MEISSFINTKMLPKTDNIFSEFSVGKINMNKCYEKHSFEEMSTHNAGMYRDSLDVAKGIFGMDKTCTFFDIGAGAGSFLRVLKSNGYLAANNTHCFEPHQVLSKDIQKCYPNAVVNACCVGDQETPVTVHVPEWSTLMSSINTKPDFGSDQRVKQVTCDTVTLDNYCTEYGVDQIDFLKVSVNGYEKQVFDGSTWLLTHNRILAGVFDTNSDLEYIKQLLAKHNYKIYQINASKTVFISLIRWKEKKNQ